MARRYAIQHLTSLRFISEHPAYGIHAESPDEAEAVAWSTEAQAELERAAFEDFGSAWQVVPITRVSDNDPVQCEYCQEWVSANKKHKCQELRGAA